MQFSGIYLNQSNSIFVRRKEKSLQEHFEIYDHHRATGKALLDWREIDTLLIRDHEESHFQNLQISPFLSFFEDLHDLYGSAFYYLCQNLRESGKTSFKSPLIDQSFITEFDNYRLIQTISSFGEKSWLGNFNDVNEYVDQFNFLIKCIGSSKGLKVNNLSQVIWDRSEDLSKIELMDITSIVEGLARSSEKYILKNANASQNCWNDWAQNKLGSYYGTVINYLERKFKSQNIAAFAMNLSLRGHFFPFTKMVEFKLEEFFPSILLPRIVEYIDQNFDIESIELISNPDEYWEKCNNIITCIIEKFNLVNDSVGFDLNWESLNRNFNSAFPDISNHSENVRYEDERKRYNSMKNAYYVKVKSEPCSCIERLITPERIFYEGRVYSEKKMTFPSRHDWRFIHCCFADWVIFGNDSSIQILNLMFSSLQLKSFNLDNPVLAAKEYYGIEIDF